MSNAVSLGKENISKYGTIKLLHRALAHLFDVCKKFSTVELKGQGFSQTLQDVFSLLLICLILKFYLRHFNKKDAWV